MSNAETMMLFTSCIEKNYMKHYCEVRYYYYCYFYHVANQDIAAMVVCVAVWCTSIFTYTFLHDHSIGKMFP